MVYILGFLSSLQIQFSSYKSIYNAYILQFDVDNEKSLRALEKTIESFSVPLNILHSLSPFLSPSPRLSTSLHFCLPLHVSLPLSISHSFFRNPYYVGTIPNSYLEPPIFDMLTTSSPLLLISTSIRTFLNPIALKVFPIKFSG
jgi:hypothetical protein